MLNNGILVNKIFKSDERLVSEEHKGGISMINKKIAHIIILIAALAMIFVAGAVVIYSNNAPPTSMTNQSDNRQITDMVGRTLIVPPSINRVACTSPPVTNLVYMLDPDRLIGWNSLTATNTTMYMPDKYKNLPIIGGWFGTTTGNYETFISMSPDIVLEAYSANGLNMQGTDANSSIVERQNKMGSIPVIGIADSTDATKYAPEIRYMGDLLGGPAKTNADKLISFYSSALKKVNSTVATIPDSERKRVYYAEGPKGLQTEPEGSAHAQLIDVCGGINVCDLPASMGNGYGMASVSMEQVVKWNPDVIICGDPTFYASVYSDPLWQNISAVKNRQVYMVPKNPLSWMDRPPGVNQIIGIPWLAKVLYPDKFQDVDMVSMTREFYSDFYHYSLTDDEARSLLASSGLKDF